MKCFLSCLFAVLALGAMLVRPAAAQDHLLFCNTPERINSAGAFVDYALEPGETYTLFFHYKNYSGSAGPFVIALHGTSGKPLRFTARQGMADPQSDPPTAGRQAMARFLGAQDKDMTGKQGFARFDYRLGDRQVASGVISVCCETPTRLRMYFKHDNWTVKGSQVIAVTAPRQQIEIALDAEATKLYYRIGDPEEMRSVHLDGYYGMLYAFRIAAPEGRKVRVAFSPRGGKGGLVGSIAGKTLQSDFVPATHWRVFCETVVGKNGLILTTAPFGGVFYPVELLFELM